MGSVLCWAAVPVLLRYLTGSIDAWTANGIRYPFSAVLYWPILWHAHRSGHLDRRTAALCVIPATLALGGQIFWALAPYYLPASSIGFYLRFALVWSVVAAVTLFPDERRLLKLTRFYVGLGLCVGGFVALSLSTETSHGDVSAKGIVIMFFCSVFFGLYSVSVRRFLQGTYPLIGFGVVSQYVSLGTLTAMFVWGMPSRVGSLGTEEWAVLATSSVLGVALGHFFLYAAVQSVGAAITSGVQSVTPFLTVIMATTLLGETMTMWKWTAGLTMVAGAAVLLSAQHVMNPDLADSK